ncbi:predicted protein [Nematostella vectensis]|uniref:GPN-loop GTPase n=1 Tax=Nematostella vectensis TaxID=45351 RepID=A7RUM5_NEMVE|nr:predicted protein [Nematostella vectensis]|eukprot:XP_001636993.1 predicted protein [Nematostella vectensis]
MAAASGGVEPNGANEAKPTCILVLGMAGSGKTTFVQRLTAHLHAGKKAPYVVNLDPAVHEVPYPVNIDVRDTVNYKEVMKQYGLGPNGGIVTSLNLFATRFDQVMTFLEKRGSEHRYAIFDTPGQIEVFTWSASGSIITEALASLFPTVVVYMVDIPRSTSPVTFMSNMLYACSILYKTKLPFVVVLNKTDIVDDGFIREWMQDFETFEEALSQDTTYMSSLTRSMSLVLDEFYQNLDCVGVSSMTGAGIDEFLLAVGRAEDEYEREYKPEYEKLKKEKLQKEEKEKTEQMEKLKKDLGEGQSVPLTATEQALLHTERQTTGIAVGTALESDSGSEGMQTDEEDEEEKKEYASFKRFLEQSKEKDKESKSSAT